MANKKTLVTAIATGALGAAAAVYLTGTKKGKKLLSNATEYVKDMDLNFSDLLKKVNLKDDNETQVITAKVKGSARDIEKNADKKVKKTKKKVSK